MRNCRFVVSIAAALAAYTVSTSAESRIVAVPLMERVLPMSRARRGRQLGRSHPYGCPEDDVL